MRSTVVRRTLLLFGGAVVLWYLVRQTGAGAVAGYLRNLGAGIVVPVVLVGIQHCLRAFAWSFSTHAADEPATFLDLLRTRLGAEALGYLSFTGAIGSQTSKVILLRKGIPARSAAATVAVDAAAAGIAGVLFTGAALLVAQYYLELPAWAATIGGILLGAGTGAWVMAAIWSGQRHHDQSLPPILGKPLSTRAAARDAMRRVRVGLVRLHGLPFAAMIVIHLLGHVALTAATWSILSMLGISGSSAVALLFEAGAKLGNTLGVLVPARLGVLEAGIAASANVIDLDPAAGVAVGLVRRMVDILWVGVGLAMLTFWPIKLPARDQT